MRRITYAGETVITTDDVAEVLVDLTAAVASAGRADAVAIFWKSVGLPYGRAEARITRRSGEPSS
jgi:hypothetical protein